MEKASMFIEAVSEEKAPEGWLANRFINIQRLYFIKGGTGHWTDRGGSRNKFIKGYVYLFPYNVSQRFDTSTTDPLDHMFIDFVSVPPILSDEPLIYEPDTASEIMLSLISELIREAREKCISLQGIVNPSSSGTEEGDLRQTVYTLTEALLMLLSRRKKIPFCGDDLVGSILTELLKNYNTDISVEALARRYGISVNHLILRFKNIVGTTPYAYLKQYRLRRAKELSASGMTVTDAAYEVGYENVSSLFRALRADGGK